MFRKDMCPLLQGSQDSGNSFFRNFGNRPRGLKALQRRDKVFNFWLKWSFVHWYEGMFLWKRKKSLI
jgi:hypothetical protein